MKNFRDWIKKVLGARIIKLVKYNFPRLSAKISYSQTGEDLLLDSFLGHKKAGFYVDIGAHDHIDLSNSFKFYKRGWTGIQIEPDPKKIEHFKKYRPKTISLNIGVGDKNVADFFIFETGVLSTFSKEEAKQHEGFGHHIIETVKVNIIPLKEVLEKYAKNQEIDFMSVDTEGYDLEVLKTNDWDKHRPHFVVVETAEYSKDKFGKKLNDIYDPFMSKIGYQKVADTFLNTIYRDQKNKTENWN